jgi:hypothetical protein
MPNVRYTFSIPTKDTELLYFINEKKKTVNFSGYIRDLIRKDMENDEVDRLEQIYQYVKQRLHENGLVIRQNDKNTSSSIDEIDKEIILDLF